MSRVAMMAKQLWRSRTCERMMRLRTEKIEGGAGTGNKGALGPEGSEMEEGNAGS